MLYNEGKKVCYVDFPSEKLGWHQDSNSKPSDPVILDHSHTFVTGIGPFGPPTGSQYSGDLAAAALATVSVTCSQTQSLFILWSSLPSA